MKVYDIAVIGAGPAGEKAALKAAKFGSKVVVIERHFEPGGAGTLSGTLPSKSLRETAQYLDRLHDDHLSGFKADLGHQMTIQELMHRNNLVTTVRIEHIYHQFDVHGVDYLPGCARFIGPHQLEVTRQKTGEVEVIEAKKFIIAVGTKPYHPPNIDFAHPRILDSGSVLHLNELPKSLLVYGGGVIGCEYACIFAKLGTQVTLVESRGQLLDFLDEDISNRLGKEMQLQGIQLKLGDGYTKVTGDEHSVTLDLEDGVQFQADYLLYANGREGFSSDLGVENVGIQLNSRKQIDVNSNYQTSVPHIYAVGDINGMPSLVSISNEEGRMAARHAVKGTPGRRYDNDFVSAIYTIPELAMYGPTEKMLKEKGVNYGVGIAEYKDLARALIIGDQIGMIKLLFDKADLKLLAAHVVGQQSGEMIHLAMSVIHFGGTLRFFSDQVFNFPSLSAGFKVAALNGIENL